MKQIKKEIRILGIDDAPFDKFHDKKCLVVATVFRGGEWIDGLLSFHVGIDGNDGTEKIINAVRRSKHVGQLQCIMLNGIALAGFNVIDIQQLSKKTKLPVIVVIRKKPNLKKIKNVLIKIKQQEKILLIKKAGKIYEVKLDGKKIYMQCMGINKKIAERIIKISSARSLIPEPIRVAHIIASGIVLGETRGRV